MIRFPARSGPEVNVPGDAGLPGGGEGDDKLLRSMASLTVVVAASIAWRWRAEARPELADGAVLREKFWRVR
jgi:hypothetical protein